MKNIKEIKQLREETGAGVLEVKTALEKAKGDVKKAKAALMKKAGKKAGKKADRIAGDGMIHSYIHAGGKVGGLVWVACETDFVAKTDDFKKLCSEVAMQVCTQSYKTVKELEKAEYMRDPSKKIIDLVNEATAKVGEKIEIKDFAKFDVRG